MNNTTQSALTVMRWERWRCAYVGYSVSPSMSERARVLGLVRAEHERLVRAYKQQQRKDG